MKCFLTGLILLIFSGAFSQHQVGHFNTTYQDPSRGNRNIETEVYYPATTAGDNSPMTSGKTRSSFVYRKQQTCKLFNFYVI